MDYPVNRPSVIVFNQQQRVNNNNNNVNNEDNGNVNELEVIPPQLPAIVNDNNNADGNIDNFDIGVGNDHVADNLEVVDRVDPTNNLRVEEYFSLEPSTVRNSRMPGVLFENVDTVINPAVYSHENSEDFTATFRQLFQSIFDNVVNRIEGENPGAYQSVRVSMRCAAFEDPVNLNWVGLNDLSSELFLIELYNLIQSQRDVITNNNLTIGFTFTKYDPNIFQ
jgi:hypothetical protein